MSVRPGGHKRQRILGPSFGSRGFLRLDWRTIGAPAITELGDSEFRSYIALLSFAARHRHDSDRDDAFPSAWAGAVRYVTGDRLRRVTRRQLERFIELGLLRREVDEKGYEWLVVADPRYAWKAQAA